MHGQARTATVERGLQVDPHRRLHVLATPRPRLATMTAGCAAAEQAFEEIAEVAVADVAKALALPLPARGRTKLLPLPIATGTQLVVGTPLLGVLEHLVRFVDRFEFLLGAGLLVLVRVVFARQLAIRRLDLGFAGIRLHTQDLVIVFEFHANS